MAQYVVRVQCGVHMTGCVCVYGASKNVLLGQKQWGADWFVKAGCVCERARVCLCVHACIHFISAGFPVQSPQSDTADDGCAAVIRFIRLGVSHSRFLLPLCYGAAISSAELSETKQSHRSVRLRRIHTL